MLATFYYIKRGDYAETLRLAEIMLKDKEDLVQKAVGWMLREVGKRDVTALRAFLDRNAPRMPRTALRYAIERFSPALRKRYMAVRPD